MGDLIAQAVIVAVVGLCLTACDVIIYVPAADKLKVICDEHGGYEAVRSDPVNATVEVKCTDKTRFIINKDGSLR